MKLKINTRELKSLLSAVINGVSNNRMIPITGLIGIEVKDKQLTLSSTDGINHLRVFSNIESDNFYAVVPSELFYKIVQKTTSDSIDMEVNDSVLEFTGNGKYKIELPLDESGEQVKFPGYTFDEKNATSSKIKLSDVKLLLNTNRSSLALTMEMPCITGYYIYDKVITTDSYKVCCNDIKLFSDDDKKLISSSTMDLLGVMHDEEIDVLCNGDKLLFKTPNTTLYAVQLEDINKYPAQAIGKHLKSVFDSSCKISKSALMAVLDRLSLFVSDYDKNAVYLSFNAGELTLYSKKSTGVESIQLIDCSDTERSFSCCIDVVVFREQVATQQEDIFSVFYGNKNSIKLVCGKITQIIALLEDEQI